MVMKPWMQDLAKSAIWPVVVLVIVFGAQKFAAPDPNPPPAPAPVVVVEPADIIGPVKPVPVGKFARFEVADLEQPQWEVFAKSDTLEDPQFGPDSNGLSGYVETATEGLYRVAVRGLRDGKVVGFATTLVVGKAPQPPPVVVDPSVPVAPPAPVVVTPSDKVTTVTYVYDFRNNPTPSSAVNAALNKLNRERDVTATLFEQGTFDGDDETPDQYKAALAAAKEKGLPALVVLAGSKVLRVIPDRNESPLTVEAIWEAAK